ncbi:twin-arginine translocation signal domain-containing protein [Nocardioides sp.]|uniref:twin-arginine translocation signal domain-containing protein n=1 Tax=Nocardioides sp. TaxID=35761 RepID=UPI002B26FC77|nr:twin-arginine translocation signal domain-containing protein [Nocardioides sp.]
MSETSRRNFMAAAGAGAAATTVVALSAGSAQAKPALLRGKGANEPVLVLVEDHKAATLRLLVGDQEVVVEDRDLVTRILNAAGGK